MKTDPSKPAARQRLTVAPSEQHARVALREMPALMAPLVRWLLRNGVNYSSFADALKPVFVAVAREELAGAGAKVTDSALSVLSGVHRKDVRALAEKTPGAPETPRSVPLASQVFTRWLTDKRFTDQTGAPRSLPRIGTADSFEALSREMSTDVHPRTVLDELRRLGLVEIEDNEVVPRAHSFVPAQELDDVVSLFAANVADHLSAAVHNLTEEGPKMLEQAVYANGLTPESARRLGDLARGLWTQAFAQMVREARACVDQDATSGADSRVRFGVYFYADPAVEPGDDHEVPAAAPGTASGPVGSGA